jgi:hypothetical protein
LLLLQLTQPTSPPVALSGHSREVTAVAWCPGDHCQLATASDDASVRVWALDRGSSRYQRDFDHCNYNFRAAGQQAFWERVGFCCKQQNQAAAAAAAAISNGCLGVVPTLPPGIREPAGAASREGYEEDLMAAAAAGGPAAAVGAVVAGKDGHCSIMADTPAGSRCLSAAGAAAAGAAAAVGAASLSSPDTPQQPSWRSAGGGAQQRQQQQQQQQRIGSSSSTATDLCQTPLHQQSQVGSWGVVDRLLLLCSVL